jgi:hypothetical protein
MGTVATLGRDRPSPVIGVATGWSNPGEDLPTFPGVEQAFSPWGSAPEESPTGVTDEGGEEPTPLETLAPPMTPLDNTGGRGGGRAGRLALKAVVAGTTTGPRPGGTGRAALRTDTGETVPGVTLAATPAPVDDRLVGETPMEVARPTPRTGREATAADPVEPTAPVGRTSGHARDCGVPLPVALARAVDPRVLVYTDHIFRKKQRVASSSTARSRHR